MWRGIFSQRAEDFVFISLDALASEAVGVGSLPGGFKNACEAASEMKVGRSKIKKENPAKRG
jgi:hypothetical protein